jgi:hypothetical protein
MSDRTPTETVLMSAFVLGPAIIEATRRRSAEIARYNAAMRGLASARAALAREVIAEMDEKKEAARFRAALRIARVA